MFFTYLAFLGSKLAMLTPIGVLSSNLQNINMVQYLLAFSTFINSLKKAISSCNGLIIGIYT